MDTACKFHLGLRWGKLEKLLVEALRDKQFIIELSAVRRARHAVTGIFLLFGLFIGTWHLTFRLPKND